MRGPGSKPSLLFQLVVPATAVFVVTILSLIAVVFSDPRAPVAQWLNQHGNKLLVGEFVVVIILSILAMTVDRIQTLRQMKQDGLQQTGNSEIPGETSPVEK
jgi:hypothetical protein